MPGPVLKCFTCIANNNNKMLPVVPGNNNVAAIKPSATVATQTGHPEGIQDGEKLVLDS